MGQEQDEAAAMTMVNGKGMGKGMGCPGVSMLEGEAEVAGLVWRGTSDLKKRKKYEAGPHLSEI